MKMFMLKSFCIVTLMSISVLAGMQLAKDGIHEMKGNRTPNSNTTIAETDNASHDIFAKQQRLEKMNTFNLFSSMGKALSDGISAGSEKIINSITK